MKIFILIIALILLPTVARAQCDGIQVVQEGPTLRLDHDASFNCAVYELQHTVVLSGDTLKVSEYAIADAWMDCYCPYRSNLAVDGLAAGDYVLVWGYGEQEAGGEPVEWFVCETTFTMNDPCGGGEMLLTTDAEGCGIIPTGVPGHEAQTWSALKARFD